MATDLNRITIIGRMTRDPELRQSQNGTPFCKFSIANNRTYTHNGERREEVSFFNVTAWSGAEAIAQYCKKGKGVAIDGRLKQRQWQDQDGKDRSAVEIIADSVQFLSDGKGGQEGKADQSVGHGYGSAYGG